VRISRLPPSRRVWIFDLDNTLHDARTRIFPSMHAQINRYLQRRPGHAAEELMVVQRYFDPLNFAGLVRCPTLVGGRAGRCGGAGADRAGPRSATGRAARADALPGQPRRLPRGAALARVRAALA